MRLGFSLALKFTLVIIAFSVPLVTSVIFRVNAADKVISFSKLEQRGNQYLLPLNRALIQLNLLQLLGRHGTPELIKQTGLNEDTLRKEVSAELERLANLQLTQATELKTTTEELEKRDKSALHPDKVTESWNEILSSDKKLSQTDLDQKYSKFADQLVGLITYIGNSSNLILDPDLDSYYVMDTMVLVLPAMSRRLVALLRSIDEVKRRVVSDPSAMRIQLAFLQADVSRIEDNLTTSLKEDGFNYGTSATLQGQLAKTGREFLEQTRQAITFEQDPLAEKPVHFTPTTVGLLRSLTDVYASYLGTMDELLNARIDHARNDLKVSLLWIFSCWTLAGVFAFLVQKSVRRSLKQVYDHLNEFTGAIRSSSAALQASSSRLAESANQEAAAIQQSVAAMAQMTSMLAQSASHSEAASATARATAQNVEDGTLKMKSMADSMGTITAANARLKDITRIIEDIAARTNVINDIVFKTQLLAVNASIEAARAGHHGKGFAVVANEVANLATISGKAAEEIRTLLSESRGQVNSIVSNTAESVEFGKQTSDDALHAFTQVANAITEINGKVQQIFDATKEQELGVRQTSQAMSHLNSSTTSNTATARENAQLSEQIKQYGDGLTNIAKAMQFVMKGYADDETGRKTRKRKRSRFDELLDDQAAKTPSTPTSAVTSATMLTAHATSLPDEGSMNHKPALAVVPKSSGGKLALAEKIAKKAGIKLNRDTHQATPPAAKSATQDGATAAGRFAWQASYDIGVDAMNHDHQRLLKLMADLETAYTNEFSAREQLAILDDLAAFTVKHFQGEEAYMASIDYPDLATHQAIHKSLLERLESYAARFKSEGAISAEFFNFLRTWLTAHIMGIDIKYGNFAKNTDKAA